MNLWEKAGRLTGPTPLMVSRRGQVRPPTREEAAAMLEAAIAALEAAGVPVRVMNTAGCAVVLVKGGRWKHEEDDLVISAAGAAERVQSGGVRASSEGATLDPRLAAAALPHGRR